MLKLFVYSDIWEHVLKENLKIQVFFFGHPYGQWSCLYPCTWSSLDPLVHISKSILVGNFCYGNIDSLTHKNVSKICCPGNWWSWLAWCRKHGSGRLPGDRITDGAGDRTSSEGPRPAPSLGGVTSYNMGSTSSVTSSVKSIRLLALRTIQAQKPKVWLPGLL